MSARIELALTLSLDDRRAEIALRTDARAVAIVGPSGIGKSSLLRVIAGLRAAPGRVEIDGRTLADERASLPPEARAIGFVPQDALLFPHLSVRENLAFARPTAAAMDEAIALTEVERLLPRAPATLSGGERQRVAIARALLRDPRTLLFDEPLVALDRDARARLAERLARWAQERDVTVLLVAHDDADVSALASEVFVMSEAGLAPRER